MKDNVIQLPGVSEREWKKIDKSIRTVLKEKDAPEDFTEDISKCMKEILFEANKTKDFSVSYGGDIQETVEDAVELVCEHYKGVVEGLLGEIVKREFKLYKCKKEHN
jgi:hypothetical protein